VALKSATLRPDTSQDLSGVYASTDPSAYPISAYSYLVTQCPLRVGFPTCKGAYPDPRTTSALAAFLRYIACDGQINMARIGYAPLPPNLSQVVADAIGRMAGRLPEHLTAATCANPTFSP
jgi:phosphate transport system substrate-binding protein